MDTLINIFLILAMLLMIVFYYFRIFRHLLRKPILFFIYLFSWLMIIFIIYVIVDKIYFNTTEIIDEINNGTKFIDI